jgi:hypothetical protein
VQIITASEVQDFRFDQGSKSVTLTLDTNTPMLAIIPKSLLGGPYSVSGSGDQVLDFRQYHQNSTHSWIRVEPNDSGTVTITGTTVVPELIPLWVAMMFAITLFALHKKWPTHR